jgi:parallel beta-helix repeat protein
MRFRVFIVATVAFLLTYALLASVAPERQMTALRAHSTTSALTTSSCHGNGAKRCLTPTPTTTTTTTTSSSSPTSTTTTTATSTTTSSPTTTTTTSTTTTTAGCVGPALTSQSQVQPNASYCGGVDHSRIVLANGDTWTGGEVSGAVSGSQQGAVQCGSPCALVNMNIHDNPGAFAGIYMPGSGTGPNTVSGGVVSYNGSLGIGGSGVGGLTISGVEIDHNGASASCGFEGGGFKGVNHGSRFTGNYVHANYCVGVWYDINAATNEIDHNRVDNNSQGGIFYEISQDATIHDNEVSGNGFGKQSWLWGAGIGIASSFNIQVYGNTLSNNFNGIGETQQNRTDSTPPAHLLENVYVHNNAVNGVTGARTGAAEDNGADLTTRNVTWSSNALSNGATFCGLSC